MSAKKLPKKSKKPAKPQINIMLQPLEREVLDEIEKVSGLDDTALVRQLIRLLIRAYKEDIMIKIPSPKPLVSRSKADLVADAEDPLRESRQVLGDAEGEQDQGTG